MAGITTPFTTPVFPVPADGVAAHARQHHAGVHAGDWPERGADSADAGRRHRPGRVRGGSRPRIGLRAAVERLAAARADVQHHDGGRLRRLEDHARRAARRQSQPADGRAARAGPGAAAARAQSVLRHHPALVVARRSDHPASPSCSSRIRSSRPSACIATTSARRSTRASTRSSNSGSSRGLSYLVSYTRSKLMDDASSVFDASILTGPVANFPVADSFNRRLERDYSTGDIPHVFVASAVWDVPFGAGRRVRAERLIGRAGQRLDADRRAHAAVGHARRDRADDQQQRLRRFRHPAPQPDRRSGAAWPTSGPSAAGSTPAPSPPRRSSRSAPARATRFAARATATSTSR